VRTLGPKQLFSVNELEALLGVSRRTVRQMTEKLPGGNFTIGQNYYVTASGVRAAFQFNDHEYAHLVRMARERDAGLPLARQMELMPA